MQNIKRKVLRAESAEYATLKKMVEDKETAEQEVEKSNVWRKFRKKNGVLKFIRCITNFTKT